MVLSGLIRFVSWFYTMLLQFGWQKKTNIKPKSFDYDSNYPFY